MAPTERAGGVIDARPDMNEVEAAQREVVDEFSLFDNWMDRYQYLIDLGKRLPEFPSEDKTDANKVRGCQSQVWFTAESRDDRLHFRAISDAAIVSGLIAVLLRIYSDKRADEILATPARFVDALQLQQHLSPTRSNGLASMMKAIQQFAAEAA
jgi:cysteine desulfuration protein SufE